MQENSEAVLVATGDQTIARYQARDDLTQIAYADPRQDADAAEESEAVDDDEFGLRPKARPRGDTGLRQPIRIKPAAARVRPKVLRDAEPASIRKIFHIHDAAGTAWIGRIARQ